MWAFFHGQSECHDQERAGVKSAQDGPGGQAEGKEQGKKDLSQEEGEERGRARGRWEHPRASGREASNNGRAIEGL